MSFGVSGIYKDKNGRSVEFGVPLSKRAETIGSLPDNSITVIRFYAHGSPGMIGNDDIDSLTRLLKSKVRARGHVHLQGCATGGVETPENFNPVHGWGLYLRMAMYHGIPKLMNEPGMAEHWSENLARDLSLRLPNVYVTGLGGISFAVSQLKGARNGTWIGQRIADMFGDNEGYNPTIIGDEQIYMNGKRVQDATARKPKREAPAAGAPGQALGRWR